MRFRLIVGLVAVAAVLAGAAPARAAVADDGDHGGRPLTAALSGANEVPAKPASQTGTAVITLNQGQGEVCYEITVAGISSPIVAAHIHVGAVGVNGPIVVPLPPLSGCVSADPELIKAIRQDPEAYYVNVHTKQFPGGATRGQLTK